jgi:hypothetical protein
MPAMPAGTQTRKRGESKADTLTKYFMRDPSGLRVIEALCPSVSRYAMGDWGGGITIMYSDEYPTLVGTAEEELLRRGVLRYEFMYGNKAAELVRETLKACVTEMRFYG